MDPFALSPPQHDAHVRHWRHLLYGSFSRGLAHYLHATALQLAATGQVVQFIGVDGSVTLIRGDDWFSTDRTD